ncbi:MULTISPECIES: PDR/VanB family oxidoreductase [Variovorax]|jgi:vanillate monooxygenase ferredoxin subunit|uniref:PDR/VanB family oxidoreductase n=1 Tax=Variovorax TaxID=34072 RepID=UPI00086956D8|nr:MULTISPECIES: PDR/VanB family oxidoreductase [Variovorax]MBN8754833.1 oxidoreductase [Variovorax sp.]ODU11775.1 MAG: Vanillate O-demethylase oxidoreductase [Variovorax sp. SCN 67-85]ODV14862.1 MAG: Vanillate O-demethylase oxidoreductase [Variovorax sp. SCN 67-20]OJZ05421.1 MAG: oxidoreductase [Variovorax sp. 67-131]UKI05132.1 PDR/VanB family oxidoreductase [Variovorax paradoxus]
MSAAAAPAIAVRVARKTVEAEGVAGFRLVAADGARLPDFAPGAHIDVSLPGGLVRQYSLCNLPAQDDHYEIGVLRDAASRGGSLAMHDAVHEGAVLNISPPRNHFPLDENATHSLLLAGGIGVTPLLSMARRLAALGADFALHCCSRTAGRAPYRRQLEGSAFADKVFFHHDDGPPAQWLDPSSTIGQPAPGRHLYVCGPQGFLDAVRTTARALRWPDAQVHFEYFAGAALPAGAQGEFEVELRSSGRVVRVPAALSVVDALAAEGIDIPVSCAQGVCGTCLTRVLQGEVEHNDLYLTPAEQAANDQFLPCCSRARSPRLVLDL